MKGVTLDTLTGATGDGVVQGNSTSGGNLYLRSTSHATKGAVLVEDGAAHEVVLTANDFSASQGSPALTSYLTSAGTTQGFRGWAMDGASDEAITTSFRLPSHWLSGHITGVTVRAFLSVAAGAGQDVRWAVGVNYMTVGDVLAGTGNNFSEDIQNISVASGAQYTLYEDTFIPAPSNALAAGDTITLTILRRGGQAADDYNSDFVVVDCVVTFAGKVI